MANLRYPCPKVLESARESSCSQMPLCLQRVGKEDIEKQNSLDSLQTKMLLQFRLDVHGASDVPRRGPKQRLNVVEKSEQGREGLPRVLRR